MITRVRPYLGTFVKIQVSSGANHGEYQAVHRATNETLITGAFNEIARLQEIFNFHDRASVLSQLNCGARVRNIPFEFDELLDLCVTLTEISQGTFNPERNGGLDLSGVAKGFIVDKTVAWIKARAPEASGVVNAGGDLRFFDERALRRVSLRLGTKERAFSRTLKLCRLSVATSAPQAFNSRPTYNADNAGNADNADKMKPRAHSATVQAPTAAVADALTKVALFAPQEIVANCCAQFSAISFLFDETGELTDCQGAA